MVYTIKTTYHFTTFNIISIFINLIQPHYHKTNEIIDKQKHLTLIKSYFLTKQ